MINASSDFEEQLLCTSLSAIGRDEAALWTVSEFSSESPCLTCSRVMRLEDVSQLRTCATSTGGSLCFGPECAAFVEDGVSLLALKPALEDFAFEFERTSFSCIDSE